ncbi:hypothetical protein LRD69_28325 [Streptomyces sp. JH14]|uniref:hypothetical protein n=1 Tax=Streptomyces sp. JH14 TaxID=2793630 RepID=UPI0023F9FB13|nr:hypothetical protein [Streptomyces sp. JH14]MDF6045969.1 hypothetical protein [Streptomyces sp. JH14]
MGVVASRMHRGDHVPRAGADHLLFRLARRAPREPVEARLPQRSHPLDVRLGRPEQAAAVDDPVRDGSRRRASVPDVVGVVA